MHGGAEPRAEGAGRSLYESAVGAAGDTGGDGSGKGKKEQSVKKEPMSAQDKKKTPCKFFLQHRCTRGSDCEYLHEL